MLRITAVGTSGRTISLQVEGRLVREAAGLLETECQTHLARGSAVRLDLGEVRFVDRAAIALLRKLHRRGLEIAACSPLLRDMIQDGEAR